MNTSTNEVNRLEIRSLTTNFTLLDQAKKLAKWELQELCRAYGIRLDYRSSKIILANALANHILKNTEKILTQLTIWDLETVRDLVSIGAEKGLYIQHESCSTILDELLLIKIIRKEEDEGSLFVMSDELRSTIGPKAKEILEDETYLKRAEMNQYVQGMKTLYGVIPIEMVRYALRDCYLNTDENAKMMRDVVICPESMARVLKKYPQQDQMVLYSSIVLETFKAVGDLQSITEDGMGMKKFSYQEILDAGHRPYPIFQFEEARKLKAFLCDVLDTAPAIVDSAMYGLWLDNQPSFSNFMRAMFLINKYFFTEDQFTWDRLVVLVNEFLDAAPCWALLGHSVAEKRTHEHKLRAAKYIADRKIKEDSFDENDGVGDDYEEDGVYKVNLHIPIKYAS